MIKLHDVIQKPLLTEKSSKLMQDQNKGVFIIHPKANKPMVKEAIKKLFDLEVESVRTKIRKGKTKSFRRVKSTDSLVKHAIVTLKPGYSFNMGESMGQPDASAGQKAKNLKE